MTDLYDALQADGAVQLAPGQHPFSTEDVRALQDLCLRLPHPAGIGEENRVGVGRILVDPVDIVRRELGYAPATVEDPELADQILAIVANDEVLGYWKAMLGLDSARMRRAQTNFLYEGGEVGWHHDHESNPDYAVSLVLSLTSDYTGGEFLAQVTPDHTKRFRLETSDLLVARPELRHAVTRVESGTRVSAVMFLA